MLRRLPQSLSEADFRLAWKDSRDSSPSQAGAPGVDRVSAARFSSELSDNIRHIRVLIQRDNYQFERLRVAPVPKASGGERIIAIPTVRDRLVQRVLLRHLERDTRFPKPSAISFGFSKGRTLGEAQQRALKLRQDHPWVIQSDIIKFFDRIDRKMLMIRIRKSVRSKVVRRLIEQAIGCELDERDPKARSLLVENQIKRGEGLRQGMPLSPMLSNLLLTKFDQAVVSGGLNAVRYADDIAIFCDSRLACIKALGLARAELKKLRLSIPELEDDEKTRILSPTETVKFLGCDIAWAENGYRLGVPSKRLRRVEEKLKETCSVEYCCKQQITLPQALSSIESSIVGHERSVRGLDGAADFIARLRHLQVSYSKRLLISIIGKAAVENLTDEKLAVLGLRDFPVA